MAPKRTGSPARKQCKACPWKVATDPYDIPGGYCARKHADLRKTVQAGAGNLAGPLRLMACHKTPPGKELPCVGWLANQLGPGNNLGLRLRVMTGQVSADFELDGEQHTTFEDTLPGSRCESNQHPNLAEGSSP